MQKTNKLNTRVITECALLIAMGTILAQIRLFRMPFGGSITAVSMLPFILISYRHGTKAGVLSGLVNAVLQIVLGGISMPPAGTAFALALSIFLDYAVAYVVLGTASVFAKPFMEKRPCFGVLWGCFAVCFIRFLASFISGFAVWDSLTQNGLSAVIYSLGYNASYLLPETGLTMLVLFLLYKKLPRIFSV